MNQGQGHTASVSRIYEPLIFLLISIKSDVLVNRNSRRQYAQNNTLIINFGRVIF